MVKKTLIDTQHSAPTLSFYNLLYLHYNVGNLTNRTMQTTDCENCSYLEYSSVYIRIHMKRAQHNEDWQLCAKPANHHGSSVLYISHYQLIKLPSIRNNYTSTYPRKPSIKGLVIQHNKIIQHDIFVMNTYPWTRIVIYYDQKSIKILSTKNKLMTKAHAKECLANGVG